MQLLEIDETQATAILDLQLRRLAALERNRIIEEAAEIEATIADLQDILARPGRQRKARSSQPKSYRPGSGSSWAQPNTPTVTRLTLACRISSTSSRQRSSGHCSGL